MMLSWIGVIFRNRSGCLAFDLGVFIHEGLPTFISRFNALSGTTYQAVFDPAKAGSRQVPMYTKPFSLTGGITYVALNTLGTTYTAEYHGRDKTG